MPEKTYKIVEVVGVSDHSIHQAVRNALTKASQTCAISTGLRSSRSVGRCRKTRKLSSKSTCASGSGSKAARSTEPNRAPFEAEDQIASNGCGKSD